MSTLSSLAVLPPPSLARPLNQSARVLTHDGDCPIDNIAFILGKALNWPECVKYGAGRESTSPDANRTSNMIALKRTDYAAWLCRQISKSFCTYQSVLHVMIDNHLAQCKKPVLITFAYHFFCV